MKEKNVSPISLLHCCSHSTMVQPIHRDKLQAVLNRAEGGDELGRKIAYAVQLIHNVLDRYTDDAVAISFNGGKDCTVLLHLFAAVLFGRHTGSIKPVLENIKGQEDARDAAQASQAIRITTSDGDIPDTSSHAGPSGSSGSSDSTAKAEQTCHLDGQAEQPYPTIKAVYITGPDHFEQLDDFTADSVTRYGMDIYRYGGDMKAALNRYLAEDGGKGVKAILVGTRTGDPNGSKSASLLLGERPSIMAY